MVNLHLPQVPEHAAQVTGQVIQGAIVTAFFALASLTAGILIFTWFIA
jgi:hypothetical protein